MLLLMVQLAVAAPSLRESARVAGADWPPARFWIAIDKSDHELVAWSGGTVLKRYRVGLGDPDGDKIRQGDLKTPTGTFRVVTRNGRSQFHLFLGLSYPDVEDADRGVRDGLITEPQARSIRAASAAGRQPPWGTTLGGAVGIHGGGSAGDWTLGCIALEDAEIDELWAVAPIGTRVVITE